MVRYLCEAGADKDKAYKEGLTPMFIAAFHGHMEIVRPPYKAYKDAGHLTKTVFCYKQACPLLCNKTRNEM